MSEPVAQMLDELQRLEKAATPGPWHIPVANVFRVVAPAAKRGIVEGQVEKSLYGSEDWSYPEGDGASEHADRKLIAALRNAAPQLIQLVSASVELAEAVALNNIVGAREKADAFHKLAGIDFFDALARDAREEVR